MSPKLGLPSPFYTPWIRHLGTCTCGRLTNQFHGYHSSCRRGRGSSVEQALEYMNHTFYEFPFWGFSNFHPGFLSMRFNGCINQQPLQPWLEDQRSVFFMFLKNQTYLNLRSILKSFAGVVILVFKATYPISIYGDFLVTEEEFSSR